MDKHFILVYFFSIIIFSSSALKIKNILVPPIEQLDENKSVILDCDFDAGNDTAGLVLKWFYDDQIIYQWIMNQKPQQVGELFKDKLDLNYKATNDKASMYRALKIKQLSLDLTGEYKCVVFNYFDEDTKSKRMIIVNGPEKLEMLQLEAEDDHVSISCSAYGVYPEPIINITYSSSSTFSDTENQSIKDDDNGLYNVTQIVTMRADELEDLTEFMCELSFPDTNFTIDKKLTFIPGSLTTEHPPDFNGTSASEISSTEDNASIAAPSWIILLTTLTTLMSSLLST